MSAILETENLTKRFGGLVAVDQVDLTIEEGELRSLIGPNGAGKSTLINLITRMLEQSAGDIRFEGESITALDPHEVVQRGIGKSFQTASIFPDLTVEQNANIASFGAEHGAFRFNFLKHRNSYPAVKERTLETLEAVGLYSQRDVRAADLPYGDKRRLEIGIALASEPALLLMDEPTAGMSPEETQATVDLIEDLQDEMNLTILLVEHDMEIVFSISDRIAVLHSGAIIAEGTPDEVQGDPQVQEAYLGGVEL